MPEAENSENLLPETNGPSNSEIALPNTNARSERVLDLAVTILKALGHSLPSEINDVEWEISLEEAAKRADFLLRKVQKGDYVVYAYELFKPGEVLSAKAIAERFKESGWKTQGIKGLNSPPTVEEVFEKIGKEILNHPNSIVEEVKAGMTKAIKEIIPTADPLQGEFILQVYGPVIFKSVERGSKRLYNKDRQLPSPEAITELTPISYEQFYRKSFIREGDGTKFRPFEILRLADMLGLETNRLTRKASDLDSCLQLNSNEGDPFGAIRDSD